MAGRLDRDRVAASVLLSRVAEELGIAFDHRRSNPARGDFWAACPVHEERSPSFHVDDRKGYFYCFGCGVKGSVFDLVMLLENVEFPAAVRRVADMAGIGDDDRPRRRSAPARPPVEDEGPRRLELAMAIWDRAEGRDGEGLGFLRGYLRARGVDLDGVERLLGADVPATLRVHPDLPCREGGEVVHRGPAMVALVGRKDRRVGIHRTWIDAAGRARLRDGRKVPKQWLGLTGAMRGQPVALSPPRARMVVGEGIETTLAALGAIGAQGWTGWGGEAALSLMALCGGARRESRVVTSSSTGRPLPSAVPDFEDGGAWVAPEECDELWLLAEGSEKDPEASARHYLRGRRRHARRADGGARRVRVHLPGGDWAAGLDFADWAAGPGDALND